MAVPTPRGVLDDTVQGRVRAILDSLLDPHVRLNAVRDESGRIVDFVFADANTAACAFNRLPHDDLVGRHLLDLHPAAEPSGLLSMYVGVVESGDPLVLDDWSYPQDLLGGEERRYDVRCVKVGDGLTQTWRDVTGHHRILEALELSQAEYRLLAENATDLVYRTDREQRVTWVSPSIGTSLGWEPEDFLGHRMTEFLHSDDVARLAELRDAALREDSPTASRTRLPDFRMRTKDGRYRWMTGIGTGVPADDGRLAGLIYGLHDVDDLVQARLDAEAARAMENRTRLSMDAAAIGMALIGPDQRLTYVNPAMSAMLGYPAGELEGLTFRDITHPDDLAKGIAAVRELVSGRVDSFTQRKRYIRRGGGTIWVDLSVALVRQRDGSPDHFVAQLVDVSEEVANADALRGSTEHYRLLAENASDVVFQTDLDDVVTWVSPSVTRVLGWPAEAIVGTHSLDLVHPDCTGAGRELRQQARAGQYPTALKSRYRTAGGGFLHVSTLVRPVVDAAGLVTGAVFGIRDVTEEHQSQVRLEYAERQFRLVLEAAPQGMAVSTSDNVVVMANPALCRLLDVEEPEILGRSLLDFLVPEEVAHERRRLAELTEDSPTRRLEHRLVSGDHEVWVDHAVSRFDDPSGSTTLLVHQFVDETAAHRLQLELTHRATHDPLTGVANREASIALLAERAAGPGGPASLLFCDVDNLKIINDRYGHPTGDAVISALAERLTHSVRQADSVGRIGGDEFLVILADVGSTTELQRIAAKLQRDVSHPVRTDDHLVDLTLSVGAVVVRPGEDPDIILARADRALYRAKEHGRNRVEVDLGM